MKRIPFLLAFSAALCLRAQQDVSFALPNGLKVRVFEDHSLPLIRGELRLALPKPTEDGEAWLRPLGFRMLDAGGSGTRDTATFAQVSDAIGLDLRLSLAADAAVWSFSTRSQDQEAALALLADQVARPAFDPIALEASRGLAWSELSQSDALVQARLRFARSLAALPEPDALMLGAVDTPRLAAWHHRLFRPEQATLVLWGDLDAAQARQLALLSLGAWTPQNAAPSSSASLQPEPGPFLAALPGEAPAVTLGLVADGTDTAQRRFLRAWVESQLRAGGLSVETDEDSGALMVSATAPIGISAETLRARLAAALDALPEALTDSELAAISDRATHQQKLMGLHPATLVATAAQQETAPADLAAARTALSRWCAAANRRLFASGDPGSLQGLQASTPKR